VLILTRAMPLLYHRYTTSEGVRRSWQRRTPP
jgi:hypothetical protein